MEVFKTDTCRFWAKEGVGRDGVGKKGCRGEGAVAVAMGRETSRCDVNAGSNSSNHMSASRFPEPVPANT